MIKLVEYFLKHHKVANMIIILLFIGGIFSMVNLKREQMPDVSFDIMQVRTVYPGASPEDVELHVTEKIEERLREVENIKKMTSVSMENLSIINLLINSESEDPEKIKQSVRDAVSKVSDLPADVSEKPVVIEVKASNLPVMELSVSGDVSELELRKYVRGLEDRIKEISGVSRITKVGYRKRELKIVADVDKIKENNISIFEVINAIQSRNVRQSGGTLESYVSEKKVVTLSEFTELSQVKDVIVRSNYEGYSIKVSDIAEIKDDFEDETVIYRGNGKQAIGMTIVSQGNVDIIKVANELEDSIKEYRKNLPESVNLDIITDYSVITKTMISMMIVNGIIGFILVLIILFLFLDFKSGFWSAYGIPFSIISSFLFFSIFKIDINMISLTAMILLLGIIVDDAIVMTEKIFANKQAGMNARDAGIDAVKTMFKPIAAAISTTILAFMPLLFIKGFMGRMVRDIPYVVLLLLLISLVDALFFIPVHLKNVNVSKSEKSRRYLFVQKIKMHYSRILSRLLMHRKKTIAGFGIVLVLIFAISSNFIKFMLDEDIDPDYLQIVVEAPDGTPLKKTEELLPEIEKVVFETIPEEVFQGLTTQIGHHNTDYFGASAGQYSSWAMISIFLKPSAQRKIKSEQILEDIIKNIAPLKNKYGFQKLDASKTQFMAVGRPVDITVVSSDNKLRSKLAGEIKDYLKTIKGLERIESTELRGKNELVFRLDYSKLARFGITPMDVAQSVRTAFEGTIVTSVKYKGENVDFRVRLANAQNFREGNILDIPIANNMGKLIDLRHFAGFDEIEGQSAIHHYNGKKSVTITADLNTDIITSSEANKLVKEKFGERIDALPEARLIFGGQQQESEESMGSFFVAGIMVLISIYFILIMVFDSYFQPLIIMSIIPFAVGATFITLIIHGRPLIMISLLGMLGLIGVVVNDTIVMITHLNEACKDKKASIDDVVKAASERFRPVILTTLTTFVALVPTAYGFGGDIPSIRPMVLVMAWGLVFCTAVTLVFIPCVYSVVGIGKRKLKKA